MVKYALDEMAKGRTTREIAAELTGLGCPVKFNTIAYWERKARAGQARPSVPAESERPPPVPSVPKPARGNLTQALAARGEKPAPPPAPTIDPTDTLGTLRELVRSMFVQAAAVKLSNPKLSATLTRSASDVLNTIARVEKGQAEAEDLLRITRKQIAEARAGALERFQALCARAQAAGGLLCARCSRQLSIEWGEAQSKVAEAAQSGGV